MIYHTRGQIANYQVMNPWSTTPEVRSLTITPPIQFHRQYINYWTNTYCNDNIIFINVVRTKLMNEKDYKIIPQILCLLHTMTYSSKLTTIVYWQGGPVKRKKNYFNFSSTCTWSIYLTVDSISQSLWFLSGFPDSGLLLTRKLLTKGF